MAEQCLHIMPVTIDGHAYRCSLPLGHSENHVWWLSGSGSYYSGSKLLELHRANCGCSECSRQTARHEAIGVLVDRIVPEMTWQQDMTRSQCPECGFVSYCYRG